MALLRRGCAVDFCSRMLLFVFLVLCTGLSLKGESVSPVDDSKSPTVKECRVHIEKALDKYWDTEEEDKNQRTNNDDQVVAIPRSEQREAEDDDDNEPPIDLEDQAKIDESSDDDDNNDDDDDDDDDEDDDEASDDIAEGQIDKDSEKPSDDDNNEDDDDVENDEIKEDDDDVENDEVKEDDDDVENDEIKEVEDAEEEEDDDDNEDSKTEIDAQSDNENGNGDDDDDDDVDDEKDNELGTQESAVEQESEDDGDDDDGDDDNDVSGEQNNAYLPEENDNMKTNEIEEANEIDEKKSDEIGDSVTEDTNDDDDDDDDDDDGDENSEAAPEPIDDTEEIRDKHEEVTGESDSVAVGMAPELSHPETTSEQPEATKSEEEVVIVVEKPVEEAATDTNETLEESQDEDEDDDYDDDTELEDADDESIENIYDEDDEADDLGAIPGTPFRNRDHIDAILGFDDIGTDYDKEEEKLAQSIFREIKKIQATNIKPIEMLYKYSDSTSRLLGDAEIFSKPMILFLGPWSAGKTTIINYLLGNERTPAALKTGTGITDVDFTVITHGDQRQVISGTELAVDWKYAGLQRFGQGFLDRFKAVTMPHTILKRVTIVDTPGILENRKNTERGYSFNDAFQWFIDRADAIFAVLDPNKVDIGGEVGSVLDQLKGRDVRFILNKADTIRRSDLMKVVGQLFWNLSPIMSSTEAPVIYAVSLSTKPYNPSAPAKFLADQENNFLYDLRDTMDKRVENRILYARRHAVRVRNHAKMVDCYLATYYRHKSIFSSKKNVAKLITENPTEYNIYDGLGSMTNVSRYDLPDPSSYKGFFKLHPLYDFKPLASTCSYFRGCPMEKLDLAIASELPELFSKYKKAKSSSPQPAKQEGR